ncbi:MAG: LPXTG cell wall anchor domain-containing protein [Clostridia bacterium]|nr:LPXTG cell wall anchor domain-containing protein [Clostridia bacterium]
MRNKAFLALLCALFALTSLTLAGAEEETITKNVSAQVGQRVNYSIDTNPQGRALSSGDLSSLDEFGLTDSRVEQNRIVIGGTAERAGEATVNVTYGNNRDGATYKLRIRIDGPEMPPKTGDENRPLLFAGLAALSAVGLAVTAKKLRKN